jgi:hypothetical protein
MGFKNDLLTKMERAIGILTSQEKLNAEVTFWQKEIKEISIYNKIV